MRHELTPPYRSGSPDRVLLNPTAAARRVSASPGFLVSRRGQPIAQVILSPAPATPSSGWGAMQGTAEQLGDVVSPLGDEDGESTH